MDVTEADARAGRTVPAVLRRPVRASCPTRRSREILGRHDVPLEAICKRLIDAANDGGGPDNITVLVLADRCSITSRGSSRYRGLIQSLVARELKARYRGSVLGFFWSFINPLLLLLVYSFVFKFVHAGAHDEGIEPYALFMFCGILPWTWFSSSLHRVGRRADLRRQPDQEGAVPRRDPADRHRAGEHGAFLLRRC